jgi:hypothetical protein
VVDVLSPPRVNVAVPTAELVTVPDPAKDPMVPELEFKSKVPVLLTVTAEESDIAPAAPSFIVVPEPIVVAPV